MINFHQCNIKIKKRELARLLEERDGISWDIVDTIYNNSSSTGKYWTEAALYHEHLLVCDYLLGQHSIYHINTLYYPASLKEVVKLTASDKDEIEDENYGETDRLAWRLVPSSAFRSPFQTICWIHGETTQHQSGHL